MKILVTGGTGFIGSHTAVELLNAGYEVVIMDNLYNSQADVVDKIESITGKKVAFYEADCCSEEALEKIFSEHDIAAAIHFAGYKAVGESVKLPLKYYENNLMSTVALCKVMAKHHCKKLVFSSSATVYGGNNQAPYTEDMPLGPTTNPYGSTKLMIEQILSDVHTADEEWDIVLLRYFNPIGAHESGLLGESPNDIPNNLMPYIVKVAGKELPFLHVYGNDYDTPDGTGVRDYIHVVDLAKGHVNAVKKAMDGVGVDAFNLGTGKGSSVLDVVNTFARVNHIEVPYQIDPRRPGDIATCYASTEKAEKELGWKAEKDLEEMCRDSWHFLETMRQKNK